MRRLLHSQWVSIVPPTQEQAAILDTRPHHGSPASIGNFCCSQIATFYWWNIFYHSSEHTVFFLVLVFTAFMIASSKTSFRLSWVRAEQSIYVIRFNFFTSFSASSRVTWFILEKGRLFSTCSISSMNWPGVCWEIPPIFLEVCVGSHKNDGSILVMWSYLRNPFSLAQI